MLKEHGATWGDNVRIICISAEDPAAIKAHCEKKGWDKPELYCGKDSDYKSDYKFNGIPHVMIIDANGNIAFKDHPANRKDMVQDFNNLLKGEKLTGKGCGADTPGDDDNEEEGEAKACTDEDMAKFNDEVDKFVNEDVKAIQAACKEGDITSDLLRDFCVITMEISLNPKTM